MNHISERIFTACVCLLFLTTLLGVSISADIGPKPSVRISFEGIGDVLCYGTLLSERDVSGPFSLWDGNESTAIHKGNYPHAELGDDIWKAFAEFSDADGYYFLQRGWEISQDKELAWTYYPPSSFKILLYFPELELFLISGICERYAFDSYYRVSLPEAEITARGGEYGTPAVGTELLAVVRSYDYCEEIASLIARIMLTVLIEVGIAVLFGFREKKQLFLICGVNAVTQIGLNGTLNIINYRNGFLAFTFWYIILEFFVFISEAIVYSACMPRVNEAKKSTLRCTVYALIANTASLTVGYVIARIIPRIF